MSSTDHQIVGGAGKNERLKTSFLKEIGLTTGQRQVTSVGEQLLNLDFSKRAKNKWLISDQSFIFLKQFYIGFILLFAFSCGESEHPEITSFKAQDSGMFSDFKDCPDVDTSKSSYKDFHKIIFETSFAVFLKLQQTKTK